MELDFVHNWQHKIHRLFAFLLEYVSWGLGQTGLQTRVQLIHDLLELYFLDYRFELCMDLRWHSYICLPIFLLFLSDHPSHSGGDTLFCCACFATYCC